MNEDISGKFDQGWGLPDHVDVGSVLCPQNVRKFISEVCEPVLASEFVSMEAVRLDGCEAAVPAPALGPCASAVDEPKHKVFVVAHDQRRGRIAAKLALHHIEAVLRVRSAVNDVAKEHDHASG